MLEIQIICVFQKVVRNSPTNSCINKINSRSQEPLDALDKIYNQIKEQIVKDDTNFNTAILKFDATYNKLNVAQNSSTVACYGKNF